MDVVIFAFGVCFIVLAVGFGVVFARLISGDASILPPGEADSIFSPARYRVMERLLAEADQKFVETLPDPKMLVKFRKVRIRIFRGYMQQLSDDFTRIRRAIRTLIVSSPKDRPELSRMILQQQVRFTLGMMSVECKLILYEFGLSGVDARAMLDALDAMRGQLQSLVPLAAPARA